MAIQMRRGEYGKFDPEKLLPAEWAVVLSGDPNTQDGRAAYLCFDAGNVKRMVTQEDLQKDIEMAVGDIKDTVVKESIEKVKEDALDSKVDKVTGKGLSTNDYTTEEKNKLADIKDFTGANSMNNGSAGLVPAPDKSMWRNFLCADGTWEELTLSYDEKNQLLDLNVGDGYSRVSIPTVTATTPGLMTPAMFNKFDNLIENGQTDISGNAGTATKLKTAVTVDGMNFDGSSSISHYAVCYTSGATAEKTVSLSNFKLAVGSRITVRFNYANTVANPTLNVNATGAKPIYYKNKNIPAELITSYIVLEVVYTGSYWCVIGVIDRATALSTTAVTPSATGSWYYSSAISSLANYDEIRVWLEIADGEKGWITLTRKDAAETVHTLYLTASYNARVQLKWDTTNNKVGVYVRNIGSGWTANKVSVKRIEGVR
jgi:hypothetical protein